LIHTPGETFESRDSVAVIPVQPDTASVTIPDAHLLFTAEFKRKRSDLVLTGDDGHKILVTDYFQPDLVSPEGALLSASLVELATPGQYAQAAAPVAQQPIGRVETVSGSATVTRNGVAVDLNVGDLVFQGDVVQTRSDSTLGIGFADGSAFSLKENARMALNEFVYDPNSTSNSALINLVQETVSFIASQVAKTGNMRVETRPRHWAFAARLSPWTYRPSTATPLRRSGWRPIPRPESSSRDVFPDQPHHRQPGHGEPSQQHVSAMSAGSRRFPSPTSTIRRV